MSMPMWHRRRAQRLAQLLDEAEGGRRQRRRTSYDDELAPLLELRERLTTCDPAPEIDPEFRTGLRAMLVATAEREGIGVTATEPATAETDLLPDPAQPTRTRRLTGGPRTRTAVIAGVAVGAVAFTGMSAASENAMPGDALYGVKRSTERAQLALASSDVGRGQLYLEFARTRLLETAGLHGDDLARVLEDMDRDTHQGVRLLTTAAVSRDDPAVLEVVRGFASGQRERLEALATQLSGADRRRVDASLSLLALVEQRVAELSRGMEQDCGTISSIDTLGPVPADCVTLPAPDPLSPPPTVPEQRTADNAPDATDRETSDPEEPSGAVTDPSEHTDPATAGQETDSPTEPAPATPDDVEPARGGSLLGGLNRLLGDLLGG